MTQTKPPNCRNKDFVALSLQSIGDTNPKQRNLQLSCVSYAFKLIFGLQN